MNTNTAELTAVNEETGNRETSKAEICFGAIMAIGAISGMWFVVSLMFNYLIAG